MNSKGEKKIKEFIIVCDSTTVALVFFIVWFSFIVLNIQMTPQAAILNILEIMFHPVTHKIFTNAFKSSSIPK